MAHRHVVMVAIGVTTVLTVLVGLVVNIATGGTKPSLVYGAIAVVLTLLLAGTTMWLFRLQTPDGLKTLLRAHVDEYGRQDWAARAIALEVVDDQGRHGDAREMLCTWALHGTTRLLVVAGEFGSGKTWLLRWLAHDMARRGLSKWRTAPIPVLIELGSLLDKDIATRGKLLAESVPRPVAESDLDGRRGAVLLLLDGLDELLADARSADRVRATLRGIVRAEPTSTRFLVACRAHLLETTDLVQMLGEVIADSDRQDSTRSVVQRALGQVSLPGVVCIEPVSEGKAGTYLLGSKAGRLWKSVQDQEAYRELAHVPFTIFLLEEALPHLSDQTGRIDLPMLYAKAVEAWLSRCDLTATDQSIARLRLEELARAEFALRKGEMRRNVADVLGRQPSEADQMLLDSGILSHLDGRADFRHYSLFEYFLACALHRDMCTYSSHLLSRINLIYMYNVNRFLVPMLMRDEVSVAGRGELVSCREYSMFMAETGWRREGYGIWPSMDAPNGKRASTAGHPLDLGLNDRGVYTAADRDGDVPITGVSWYDAHVYCRHRGMRLPSSDELAASTDLRGEWSATWHSEPDSQLAALMPEGLVGLNPDLRLPALGFRAIGPSGS
ncbi:NACHT domain-containing protein [Lentzea sp. NPDC005914]|uniref:NACHT domain-containing protein n=1 Tax=Lentzea sp. NPDC005914 TaxID=3154572 RepID=UPI003402E794